MGTWDDGLLDNDSAADGLGELAHGIGEEIIALGAIRPTTASTGKLCAAVGVLLQLSPYRFSLEQEMGQKIAAAVKAHEKTLSALPAPARRLMAQVAEGQGQALGERPGKMATSRAALFHTGAKKSPFGKREPSLFASPTGAAYVQGIARRSVQSIDEDFEDEDTWWDLCREGMAMGLLGVLLVLEPCQVSPRKIERWRKLAQKGIAHLEADPDDELDFHRGYYAKLDKVFALLLARFS